jgi:hypothetical protein
MSKPGSTRPRRRSTRQPSLFVLQRVRRRDLIILTGVLALACMSVLVLLWLIWPDRPLQIEADLNPIATPGPQPTHTVTYVQTTGLRQYPLAEAAARSWSADAQLVSASASWPQLLSQDQLGAPGEWSYRFYSPGKQRLFNISVQPDGQIESFEHIIKITLPPSTLPTANWAIDSPAALAIWLDYGGADLVGRNPGLEVLIQLRHLTNYPEPVWMVVGSDRRTQKVHIVVIDAKEGRVVTTTPAL